MTHVVNENCRNCRFTECVVVCPVSCFHANEVRVYIDPERCTDCGACISVCPVQAIEAEMDIDDDQLHWVGINAKAVQRYPIILEKRDPLPGAESFLPNR